MKKKIQQTQIFRHVIQLILFFLLPGLYILTFSELKSVYKMIIGGNFNFIQVFPGLIEFTTVIFGTILLGRFFCGWFCAFGTYNDWIHLISKHVFKINFKVDEQLDAALKYVKYLVLIIILFVCWTFGSTIFSSASPWDAFAQITDISYVLSNLTLGFILFALITIGAMFIERFFCRYLCPLGAVFAIISRFSIFKIRKPKDKCGKCRMCTNNCSMGLPLYKVDTVRGGECINCLKCTEVCPRKNTHANIIGEDVNSNLGSTVALATLVGLYGVNTLGGAVLTKTGLASANGITSSSTSTPSKTYKDGTYTGTGTGFRGGTTKVSVTVSGGKITKIETISNGDTPDFYDRAINTVSEEIISSQSTSVDAVSGATFSSNGIMEAVANALSQAESGSTSNTTTPDSSTNQNDTKNNTTTDNSNANTEKGSYKDGVYTGTGTGFRNATTELSVTVSGGKITKIETVSNGDTPDFYDRAINTVSEEIISSQSTSVDAVSGATFSSRGIIQAVANALSQGNSSSTSSNATTSNNSTEQSTQSTQQQTEPKKSTTTNSSSSNSTANNTTNSNNSQSATTGSTTAQKGAYKDGTYTGTGTGFRGGTTEISVTISGGKITNVTTVSNGDTPRFYDSVIDTVSSEIISAQSTSVDTVSGATYSSRGIIEAVGNALSQAKNA